jgi:hypothetical protein
MARTYRDLLGGKRQVSKANAVRLAKFFQAPLDDFLVNPTP